MLKMGGFYFSFVSVLWRTWTRDHLDLGEVPVCWYLQDENYMSCEIFQYYSISSGQNSGKVGHILSEGMMTAINSIANVYFQEM